MRLWTFQAAWLRRGMIAVAAATALSLGAVALPPTAGAAGPESVADLAEGLLDSVVNISTSQSVASGPRRPDLGVPDDSPFREFFDEFFNREGRGLPRSRRVQSLGSGFVIDPSGIIITNNHVIEGADEIAANFNDGRRLIARVIGTDTKTDIAVLQVKPDEPLKALSFGDSDAVRVGDWVMAIGNPFGLGGTVTVGILSARNRDINSGPYDDFLQTDAAINRGNSGGPLFNLNGEVIGINTAIISPTGGSIGIGFAVPSNIARHVVEQLREFGTTRRGWLGVHIQQVTPDLADGLGMQRPRGALVSGVNEKSPAEIAGIVPGDVILSFGGRDVDEMRDLPRMVADTQVGAVVQVTVLRNGAEQKLDVTVAQLDEGEPQVAAVTPAPEPATPDVGADVKALGLTLAPLNGDLRARFAIDGSVEGVVVTGVEADSVASERGLEPGAVIVEVGQQRVSTPEDVERRISELLGEKRRTALLLVADKSGEFRFVALRLQ